jgi:cation-transporting ATPase 13A1
MFLYIYRTPSIRSVVDLIRQGRCTLLSALMQQEIMMLESIIAAYTLSVLSLHNARSSERQMMASSWLIMTAAVSFSYASPLDHMHPLRPLRSLFHPAIFISIMGQAIIHIACMTLAVKWATDAMGPDVLKEVTEFFRKAKAKEIDQSTLCGEDDFVCQMNAFWTAPFLPNLLNSTVFLVETSQMIAVFFTNYKGRPWMKGMLENHPLFLSVFICIGGVIVASWEMAPQLNDMIQLAPFPNDTYRYKVVILVVSTIFGTFLWDRFCTMIFAPQVHSAILDEARRTTLKDVQPVFFTFLKVVVGVYILSTGNLILMGLAFYMYRRSQAEVVKISAKVAAAAATPTA